jgi:hypothetical protein
MALMVTDLSMGMVGAPSSPVQPGFSAAIRRALSTSADVLPEPTGPEKP